MPSGPPGEPAYVLTRQAVEDVAEITSFIASDNPDAALRLRDDLFAAFRRLGAHPGIGHPRSDLTALPVRFWTVRRRYMVVHQVRGSEVIILRVLSAYRDIAAILDASSPLEQ